MPINSPLPLDTRSRLADWLEVLVLSTAREIATRADLLSIFDLLEDGGHDRQVDDGVRLEEEILEDDRQRSTEVVLDEIAHRSEVLGDRYPFRLDVRGQDWRLTRAMHHSDPEMIVARLYYICCLLICAIRDRRIQLAHVASVEQAMPLLFQAIAAEAAAEVVGGTSVSFGWPRPEGTAFQPALQDLSAQLRLGKPLDNVPLWSNGQDKDAGIDVIAWRDFRDALPGKVILLGQVASGKNWTQKSVEGSTPRFLSWFSEHPTKHYIPAMFIPFPQHHECTGRDGEAFEAVAAAEAWLREQEFGLVVDRLRIVATAARRHATSPPTNGDAQTIVPIRDWIDRVLNVARAAK